VEAFPRCHERHGVYPMFTTLVEKMKRALEAAGDGAQSGRFVVVDPQLGRLVVSGNATFGRQNHRGDHTSP
jgi:hypothetical protein